MVDLAVLVPLILIGLLWGVGAVSPTLEWIVFLISAVFGTIYVAYYPFFLISKLFKIGEDLWKTRIFGVRLRKQIPILTLLTASLILVVMSSPLFYPDQFQGTINNRLDWIKFLFETIASIFTVNIHSHLLAALNFPQLSDISAKEWMGNVMISLFRYILAAGIIHFTVIIFKAVFATEKFYGTFDDFHSEYITYELFNREFTLRSALVDLDFDLTSNLYFFRDVVKEAGLVEELDDFLRDIFNSIKDRFKSKKS